MKECDTLTPLDDFLFLDSDNRFIWSPNNKPQQQTQHQQQQQQQKVVVEAIPGAEGGGITSLGSVGSSSGSFHSPTGGVDDIISGSPDSCYFSESDRSRAASGDDQTTWSSSYSPLSDVCAGQGPTSLDDAMKVIALSPVTPQHFNNSSGSVTAVSPEAVAAADEIVYRSQETSANAALISLGSGDVDATNNQFSNFDTSFCELLLDTTTDSSAIKGSVTVSDPSILFEAVSASGILPPAPSSTTSVVSSTTNNPYNSSGLNTEEEHPEWTYLQPAQPLMNISPPGTVTSSSNSSEELDLTIHAAGANQGPPHSTAPPQVSQGVNDPHLQGPPVVAHRSVPVALTLTPDGQLVPSTASPWPYPHQQHGQHVIVEDLKSPYGTVLPAHQQQYASPQQLVHVPHRSSTSSTGPVPVQIAKRPYPYERDVHPQQQQYHQHQQHQHPSYNHGYPEQKQELPAVTSSSQDDSPPPPKKQGRRHKQEEIRFCHVCGERAGKHSYYGGQVCPSCRAFFRRSVQSK